MNKSYEVEYCNLELRFDRRLIQSFIKALIQEGYSLYWNESEHHFIISIRSGRKLVKLKFHRVGDRYKIVGNYSFKDERLSFLMEKLIEDTRGHAIVKRFKDRQIVIENIMFGEVIRLVEISGVDYKVIYQKELLVTVEEIIQAFKSTRIEDRIPVLRMEMDYELTTLQDAILSGIEEDIYNSKERLVDLRQEMLVLEM
ncbi:MAG TPA: hypothetical protein VGE40_15085 [Bacilli bacterium]